MSTSRPLRFLHLTTFYPPHSFGGDAVFVHRLCHALGDLGHHVDVVHCVDSYHMFHPEAPPVPAVEHPNVHRHELRSGRGWLSPLLTQQTGYPLLKTAAIRKLLRQHDYDVIHYHNTSLLGPAVMAMNTPGKRTVKLYTTHEHWLVCPMHVLWKYNRAPCSKPECLRCVLHGRRPPQLWRYTGLLGRATTHIDAFIGPSRFTIAMHAERGFSRPMFHLPHFIERADDDWRRPGKSPHDRPYFLFVGRLEALKGLQTVIPLWEGVHEADLLIAGTGTFEPTLKALAASNPRIRFLGALPEPALGALYFHAIAVIVPSLTYETFGMITVEAFARRTPVVARNLGPLPEVINDSGGGLLFDDDAGLQRAVRRLASDRALRDRLGGKGYDAFVLKWTRESHLEQYFDLITRAATRKFGGVQWSPAAPRETPILEEAVV
jgi:glycosyltransferase involved in cell wall biosynthesis